MSRRICALRRLKCVLMKGSRVLTNVRKSLRLCLIKFRILCGSGRLSIGMCLILTVVFFACVIMSVKSVT